MKDIILFLRRLKISGRRLFVMVGLYSVIAIISLAQPEVLRRATAAITGKDPQALGAALVFAVCAALVFMSVAYLRDVYETKAINFYRKALSEVLMSRLVDLKMKVLDKKQFGDISTIIIRNTDAFGRTAVGAVALGSVGFISLGVTLAYMCVIQWQLALAVLLYNAVIRFFAVWVERKINKNAVEMSEAFKISGNYLSALLRNMLTVRLYSNGDFFTSRLQKNEKAVMKKNWLHFVWANGFQDGIWAFSKLAEFIIVCGVGSLLIISGQSNVSILLTFIFASDLFTIAVNNISEYLSQKAENAAYRDSLEELLLETELENEAVLAIEAKRFSIRFDHVSFGYGGRTILEDASFTLQPGEKVLITGPNGQGKSTLLKLIAGLYRPDSGDIFFGEVSTRDVHIAGLNRTYGYISQHSHMLEGGVGENIALSGSLEEQRIDETLQKLNMADKRTSHPASLSLGEQQRLNIARTFYQGGQSLVIGDEIFSNIDPENRKAVLNVLKNEYADATVLMISHEAVDYPFDRVLQVGNGQVVEEAKQ